MSITENNKIGDAVYNENSMNKCETLDNCNFLEPYKCPGCGFSTNFRVNLHKHLGQCSPSSVPNFEAITLVVPEYEYVDCQPENAANDSQQQSTQETRGKAGRSSDTKRYNCHHCSYGSNKKDLLICHLRNRHGIGTITWFSCDQCSHKTKQKCGLVVHKTVHHSAQWFHCDLCAFKTKHKDYLTLHRTHKHLSHDQINWIQCDKCDYKAKTNLAFHHHKSFHLKDKWLHCDQCEYKSTAKSSLRNHKMAKHSEADHLEWIKCNKCDYQSKFQERMKTHDRRMHCDESEIIWYNCDKCNFRAKHKSNLQQHKFLQHRSDDQIEWQQCHLCEYRGKMKRDLRNHLRYKHGLNMGELPLNPPRFKCGKCPYEAGRKGDVLEHFLKMHTENAQHPNNTEQATNLTPSHGNSAETTFKVVNSFQCGVCQYSAANRKNVVEHIKTAHLSTLPFNGFLSM